VHDPRPAVLKTCVTPSDVEALMTSLGSVPQVQQYAALAYTTGALTLLKPSDAVNLTLAPGSGEIITLAPVIKVGCQTRIVMRSVRRS
jgi:hypothetical protein